MLPCTGEPSGPPGWPAFRELLRPAAVHAGTQPNGLSSESTGVENHTGFSSPM